MIMFMKELRDKFIKLALGQRTVPASVVELSNYFRQYGPIHFDYKKTADGIVATSTNFHYGAIVTDAKTEKELDQKIKDAILTSFKESVLLSIQKVAMEVILKLFGQRMRSLLPYQKIYGKTYCIMF